MKVVGLLIGIGLILDLTATGEAKASNPANENYVIVGQYDEPAPNPPPPGEINTTIREVTPGDSEVYTEIIGDEPWMNGDDPTKWLYCDNDVTWTHTFDPEGKTILSAQVAIRAYDVDIGLGPEWEHNRVYADGQYLGELGGSSSHWSVTTFHIDPELATSLLEDGKLTMFLDVDATAYYGRYWNVGIDWSMLTVEYEAEPDYIKVTPTPAEVIIGQTQQFTAQGYINGPDGIEGTADDVGPFSVTAGWSIGQVNIGTVSPISGASTTFTAVEELPENKTKLVGHVIASVTTTEGEKIQGQAKVTVIAYTKLSYLEAVDANDSTRKSKETLQMASVKLLEKRTAGVTAYKDKPEMDWAEDEPVWWGLVEKKGVDSVTYTGTKDGKEHARAGNVPKFVTIEIVNGVEHEFSISTGTFKVFQDILVKVATALKGDKDKIKVSPISGSLKWYKVDQIRSPLCQTTYEFSVSPGGFEYDVDKFYIPSLSINFRWVKIGIFVKPDLSLKITAIEIIRDGTRNPVKFTKLSGGAGLEGSISGGAGAEFKVKKVFAVEVDLKGTASAGGDFKVGLPGPKLSGTYTIGKITVSGEVVIEYRDRPVVTKKVTKPVWDGITGEGEVDLSSFFEE